MANCVERRPLGARVSSYSAVTRRAAFRSAVAWHSRVAGSLASFIVPRLLGSADGCDPTGQGVVVALTILRAYAPLSIRAYTPNLLDRSVKGQRPTDISHTDRLYVSKENAMEDLIQRYNDAWASRDPDAIVALHTEDTTFRYHTGFEAATGKAAVRQAFTDLFARLPDLGLKPVSLRTGSDFWVAEWRMTGTAAASGAKVEVDLVDVITVKGGLVASKDSYVDAVSLQAQLGGETRPRNGIAKVDMMHLGSTSS